MLFRKRGGAAVFAPGQGQRRGRRLRCGAAILLVSVACLLGGDGQWVVGAERELFPVPRGDERVAEDQDSGRGKRSEAPDESSASRARSDPDRPGEGSTQPPREDTERPAQKRLPETPDTRAPLKRVEAGLATRVPSDFSFRVISGKEYVLGPYDRLEISVRGPKPETWEFTITPQGAIHVPLIGPVNCSGMTVGGLEKALARELARYLRNFTVSVVVTRLRGIQVTVTGHVVVPGNHSLPMVCTLWDAIQACGGITPAGSVRSVRIHGTDGKDKVVDLYPYLFRGQLADNPVLSPGDSVHVPVAERLVGLAGEVRQPGLYESKKGETLAQLLAFAGGPSPQAALDKAYVERVQPDRTKLILPLNLRNLEGGDLGQFVLEDGDTLVVPAVGLFLGRVLVSGEVRRPGSYELKQNMRLRDLLDLAGGLTESAVPQKAFLQRVKEDQTIEVTWVDLAKAGADSTEGSIVLRAGDQLVVPSVTTFAGSVSVRGEVRHPLLRQPLARGMTVRDLVNLAGGLAVAAAPRRAYLQRVSSQDQQSQVCFVDLQRALAGDPEHNLPLQDGDCLVVPSLAVYSGRVSVAGEVRSPLAYPLTDGMRVRDLVSLAGGVTVQAAPSRAHLSRVTGPDGSRRLLWVDVNKALAGDPAHNLLLLDGDKLTVPHSGFFCGKVSVTGELRSLSATQVAEEKQVGLEGGSGGDVRGSQAQVRFFDLTEGMRVSDLVGLAGGPTATAALTRARLVRVGAAGLREAVPCDLQKILANIGGPEDLLLRDGDSLHVPSIAVFQRIVRVAGELVGTGIFETVGGVVKRRGLYELKQGDTVRDLVQAAGGWTANAALRAARIERMGADGKVRRIPVDLHRLLVEQDPTADVVLENGDEFTVPALADMVYVVGAVNQPGAYEYREGNNRVMDMLARAGGVSQRALLSGVRLVRNAAEGQQEPLRVDMDAVIRRGKVHLDPGVRPGDVVFVPEKPVVMQDILQVLANISLLRFYLGQ